MVFTIYIFRSNEEKAPTVGTGTKTVFREKISCIVLYSEVFCILYLWENYSLKEK